MKKLVVFFTLLIMICGTVRSQNKFIIQNKKQTTKINFTLINDLIIIPVEVNGVELSFLLDTGVSKPIIFNFLNISDSLKLKNVETIYLRGLGEGESVKSIRSNNNIFKVGDAVKLNQDIYEIYDSNLNFAPRLGVPVHGIIGYDIFKDLIVEINYSGKHIRLTSSDVYKYKNCSQCDILNLEFYNNKPYINAHIKANQKIIPIKLLIDSGGSDTLWLFENDSLGINTTKPYFEDFLGYGLGGSIYGKRSTIDALMLKRFVMENANVAYPFNASIALAKENKQRNGTLAGNVLKRFNIIMDYNNARMTIKKNSFFNEKFSYNKSGIQLAHSGVRLVKEKENAGYTDRINMNGGDNVANNTNIVLDLKYKFTLKPAYAIVELRENSPAFYAGLMLDDVILTINGKDAAQYTLQQITHIFYGKNGKLIKLEVERNGRILDFSFKLESPLTNKA